jgi:hypothetical protein
MKYAKTELGQQAFKARSGALTPRQRSAFILFDGKKALDEVLAMTAGLGVSDVDVQSMVAAGLLELVSRAVPLPRLEVEPVLPASPAGLTPAQRFAKAWPIATRITAGLGLRGFRLNLAVEGASGYEQLRDLLPKIRDAVGAEKALELELALKE